MQYSYNWNMVYFEQSKQAVSDFDATLTSLVNHMTTQSNALNTSHQNLDHFSLL